MPRQNQIDPDNPEWTREDFAKARPASELPSHIQSAFPKSRGRQKSPTKVPVSIRLSPEVIEYFKADGPGWQRRIDDALKEVAGI